MDGECICASLNNLVPNPALMCVSVYVWVSKLMCVFVWVSLFTFSPSDVIARENHIYTVLATIGIDKHSWRYHSGVQMTCVIGMALGYAHRNGFKIEANEFLNDEVMPQVRFKPHRITNEICHDIYQIFSEWKTNRNKLNWISFENLLFIIFILLARSLAWVVCCYANDEQTFFFSFDFHTTTHLPTGTQAYTHTHTDTHT